MIVRQNRKDVQLFRPFFPVNSGALLNNGAPVPYYVQVPYDMQVCHQEKLG